MVSSTYFSICKKRNSESCSKKCNNWQFIKLSCTTISWLYEIYDTYTKILTLSHNGLKLNYMRVLRWRWPLIPHNYINSWITKCDNLAKMVSHGSLRNSWLYRLFDHFLGWSDKSNFILGFRIAIFKSILYNIRLRKYKIGLRPKFCRTNFSPTI